MRLSVFIAFFTAILMAFGAQAREGWKRVDTSMAYPQLVERVNAAVKANKMGLVTKASATVGAKKMLKKDIPGNMVIGVYRPDFAVRMLDASEAAGIEAPVRLYVTENADGTASLSYKTPSMVFSPYFDEGGEALRDMAGELDGIFAKIVADATN